MKDKHKLVTVGDINCPVCGQTLVRLDEDCNGHSKYWCDICHLNITIEDDEFDEEKKQEISETHDLLPMIEACNIDWKNTETIQMTIKFVNHSLTIGDVQYDGLDETQFDVNSIEEAIECWHQFCKENDLNWNCVESVEFDITDEQDSKIGEIDDAIMELLYTITDYKISDLKIADVVGEVHAEINKTLSRLGYKVYNPGIRVNPDGTQYIELYE